jgi:type II secretory pathway pseudopilin PulG
VEIVFALAVMIMLLTGLFASMLHSQKTDVLTRERAAASEACFAAMDAFLANPAAIGNGTATFDVSYDSGRSSAGLPVVYTLRPALTYPVARPVGSTGAGTVTIINNPDANGNTGLVEVRVTVAWRAADNTDARVDAVARKVTG